VASVTEEEPPGPLPALPPQLDSARHPFEQFVLFLGLIVGWPLLFGAPTPGSTSELLGPLLVRIWAWMLVGGCAIALMGSWWTWWSWLGRWGSRWRPRATSALLIEQVGLLAMGGGSVVYAYGIAAAVGWGEPARLVGAALVAGMGLAALWRARQIRQWVRFTLSTQE
jgi:hypothetical protein